MTVRVVHGAAQEIDPGPGAQQGFRWRLWTTGLECVACRGSIDGIGYTIQQLAEIHRANCEAQHKL